MPPLFSKENVNIETLEHDLIGTYQRGLSSILKEALDSKLIDQIEFSFMFPRKLRVSWQHSIGYLKSTRVFGLCIRGIYVDPTSFNIVSTIMRNKQY